jgi:hypothetical protein
LCRSSLPEMTYPNHSCNARIESPSFGHSSRKNVVHRRGDPASGLYSKGTLIALKKTGVCSVSVRVRTSRRPFAVDTSSPSSGLPSSQAGIVVCSGR